MTLNCIVRQRRRAETAAELTETALEAAVVLIEPESSAWDRWTIAEAIPRANTLAPGVLRALAEADESLLRLGTSDGAWIRSRPITH